MTKAKKARGFKAIILTLTLLVSVFMLTATIAGAQIENYPTISCGTETEMYFDGTDITEKILAFTPAEDGIYYFYSYNSDEDTYGYILNEDGEILTENDDSGDGRNFEMFLEMTKDTVYLLKTRFFDPEATGTAHVKVEKAIPPLSIEITNGDLTLTAGEACQLGVEYYPHIALPTPIVWTSSDPDTVSVDESGYVKLLTPGTATISATAGDLTDSITVTAESAAAITEDQNKTVAFRDGTRATLAFVPEEDGWYAIYTTDAQIETYAYLLDDTLSSIYMDETPSRGFYLQGELTAGKCYYININSLYDATKTPVNVTVKKLSPATEITLHNSEYNGYLGERLLIAPSFGPGFAIRETYTVESSDSTVVRVDEDGYANFFGIGTATVTVTTASGLTASCDFTVSSPRTISRCQTLTLDLVEYNGRSAYMSFTPSVSGSYLFYSTSNADPCAHLYESTDRDTYIGENDDKNSDSLDFALYAELTAGTEYFLNVFLNGIEHESVDVSVVLVDEDRRPVHEIEGYTYTKTHHTFDCSLCGQPKTEPHTYNDSVTCYCGYTHEHEFSYLEYEDDYHYGRCTVCDRDCEVQHSFDENGVCVCEYFAHDHKYTDWYRDESDHYAYCDLCNGYLVGEHSFGTDESCTMCGYYEHEHIPYFRRPYGEEAHESYCMICNTHLIEEHEIDATGYCVCGYHEHEHVSVFWDIEEDCHEGGCYICNTFVIEDHFYGENSICKCGYYEHEHVIKEYRVYTFEHEGICEICSVEVAADHALNTEGVCECGYDGHTHSYELWKYDEYGHTGYCTLCDETMNDAHSFGDDEKCICGYFEHTHTVTTFFFDNETHWGYCSICQIEQVEFHETEQNGACVCGYYEHEHERTEIEFTHELHHYYCTICDTYFTNVHKIGADGRCECGYKEHSHSFTEYTYDGAVHSATCETCHLTITDSHKFELDRCVCGYENHQHSFTEYGHTYNSHFLLCSACGACVSVNESQPHIFGSDGSCIMCKYKPLDVVYVGGVVLENGKYIDTSGRVTDTAPSGGYAHLKDGVLTLSNFTLIIKEEAERDEAIFTEMDIEIVLIGNNKLYSEHDDAIFVYADLTVSGSGSIEIGSGGSDGIDVLGTLTINGGTLYITAGDNAIEANGDVTVNGGILRLNAVDDGINAEADVTVNGGVIYVTSEDEGLDVEEEHDLTVNGGSIYVYSGNAASVWVGGDLYLNGGFLHTESNYENIFVANGKAYLNGGRIKATVNNKAFPALLVDSGIVTSDAVSGYDLVFAAGDSFALATNGAPLTDLDLSLDGETAGKLIGNATADGAIAYTGSALTPRVTVTDQSGNPLTEGVDYVVILPFGGIVSVGSHSVTVLGIGEYHGIKTLAVTVDEPVPPEEGLPVGAIIAISVGGAAVLAVGVFSLLWFGIRKKRFSDLKALLSKKK